MECRINAEDPLNEFAPSAGTVLALHLPAGPGVRVDTALYDGYEVPAFYDSLVAKLIAWGRDYSEARARLLRALNEFRVDGFATTTALHRLIVRDQAFRRGSLSTDFLERRRILGRLGGEVARKREQTEKVAVTLTAAYLTSRAAPLPRPSTAQSSWHQHVEETGRHTWSGLPSVL
jgi:acetyl/propionyl-CoA carboxylase alpha subunit